MNWQNVAILDGVPVVACEELQEQMQQGGEAFLERVQLVDVRRREEFVGELGHIDGAKLVVLGAELQEFLERTSQDEEIIFICRSGARSGQATLLSREMGFQNTYNLGGGMLRWNALGLPTTTSSTMN